MTYNIRSELEVNRMHCLDTSAYFQSIGRNVKESFFASLQKNKTAIPVLTKNIQKMKDDQQCTVG